MIGEKNRKMQSDNSILLSLYNQGYNLALRELEKEFFKKQDFKSLEKLKKIKEAHEKNHT